MPFLEQYFEPESGNQEKCRESMLKHIWCRFLNNFHCLHQRSVEWETLCGAHAVAWATWRCTYAWRVIPCTCCLLQPPQGIWGYPGIRWNLIPFLPGFQGQPTYLPYIFLKFLTAIQISTQILLLNPHVKACTVVMTGGMIIPPSLDRIYCT